MARKKIIKTLVFKNGTEHELLNEEGKYYITKNAKFRKNNPTIVSINRNEISEEETEE